MLDQRSETPLPAARAAMSSPRVFFGWKVLAATSLCTAFGFATVGIGTFGVFIIPLSQAFGWGRGDISFAMFLMSCAVVVASPVIGLIADRFGVRRVILVSIVLLALTFGSLALLDGSIRHFYAVYLLLPVLGAGTFGVTYTKIVVAWFERRRGLAIGLCAAGAGIGTALIAPFAQHIITAFGWKGGYLGVAALVLATFPVAYLVLRERPADVGEHPDGVRPSEDRSLTAAERGMIGFEFRQCLGRPSFWILFFAFLLLGMSATGFLGHLIPLLRDRGFSAGVAGLGASALGLSIVVGRVVAGVLLDRYHAIRVVCAFLVGPIVGFAMLAFGVADVWAWLALLMIGVAIGAEVDFLAYLIGRYFGQVAFGRVYGICYSAVTLGGGIGSLLLGNIHQARGNYDLGLWLLSAVVLAGTVLLSRMGDYPALPRSAAGQAR